MLSTDIGIDLGTSNILIYIKKQGIVVNEPSIVAIDKNSKRVLAVGKEASEMYERTPGKISAIKPLKNGVIADMEITEIMLNDLIKKVFESENTTVPIIIAKDILNKFFPFYSNIKSSSKFMNIYKEKFVLCGKKIKYLEDGKKKTFRITDIDIQNGALKIEGAGKRAVTVFSPSKVILPKKI